MTGAGTDDVGSYTMSGQWNGNTGRLAFTKTYIRGTGDSGENLGHTVDYRGSVQQGRLAAGVRGTWHVNIPNGYAGTGRFHLWPSDLALAAHHPPATAPSATWPFNAVASINNVSVTVEQQGTEMTPLLSQAPAVSAPPPLPQYRVVDTNECVVCFDSTINTILVPCGHVALCHGCACKMSTCPICRTDVAEVKTIA